MGNAITDYVVENLASDIRAHKPISAALCEETYDATFHDPLRAMLKHDDFDAIKRLCEAEDGAIQTLGISMLRQMVDEDDVYRYLQNLWGRDHLAFAAKVAVQHRLLDRQDLSEAFHEALFAFVSENWPEWLSLCSRYAGGSHNVLGWCESRLENKDFPESKKWTYLCIAAASDDPEGARELLSGHQGTSPFMNKVSEAVLARMDSANARATA